MKYGCIGEHLTHSFSKEIHAQLSDYEYELTELSPDKVASFLEKREFLATNVTIPYKETVIPHLDEIDGLAQEIGAVNTIVNRGGRLVGYNTDFFGMSSLIAYAGIQIKDKKVAILGTGGTSRTAHAVASSLGAKEIIKVTRSDRSDAITYSQLYENHTDIDVIINTTPVGMFPGSFASPVDISRFTGLSGVIDAIYNPLSTQLVIDARERGIAAFGGLYMLVAQGVRASELFLDRAYPEGTVERIFKKLTSEKENVVLVGMPSSGKSTVGALIAKKLGRPLIDTDALIIERENMTIPEIFKKYGEERFREIESEVIKDIAKTSGAVIATGGGAILKDENVRAMRLNGKIYFIDRPLDMLVPTEDRPLSSTKELTKKRYEERYGRYLAVSDVRIDAGCDADTVANKILGDFLV